jgi:hypothetical protein
VLCSIRNPQQPRGNQRLADCRAPDVSALGLRYTECWAGNQMPLGSSCRVTCSGSSTPDPNQINAVNMLTCQPNSMVIPANILRCLPRMYPLLLPPQRDCSIAWPAFETAQKHNQDDAPLFNGQFRQACAIIPLLSAECRVPVIPGPFIKGNSCNLGGLLQAGASCTVKCDNTIPVIESNSAQNTYECGNNGAFTTVPGIQCKAGVHFFQSGSLDDMLTGSCAISIFCGLTG